MSTKRRKIVKSDSNLKIVNKEEIVNKKIKIASKEENKEIVSKSKEEISKEENKEIVSEENKEEIVSKEENKKTLTDKYGKKMLENMTIQIEDLIELNDSFKDEEEIKILENLLLKVSICLQLERRKSKNNSFKDELEKK
jgi:hypothetical protein